MKLNVITALGNQLGKESAKLLNQNDSNSITIGISRSPHVIPGVDNLIVKDLASQEVVSVLNDKFEEISKKNNITHITLIHNCCKAICEIPGMISNEKNGKIGLYDLDGDGIDDRAFNSIIKTFDNTFQSLNRHFPKTTCTIGTVCSITDKKKYIPTVFRSMVLTNRKLRNKLEKIVKKNNKINSVIISASTVGTETEKQFRKYSEDIKYRLSCEEVAKRLIQEINKGKKGNQDIDLYKHHPDYEAYFKNETDEELTKRIIREIGYQNKL